jgi:hypothetical protein
MVTADSQTRTKIISLNKTRTICYKINEFHFSLRYSVHLSYKFPTQSALKQGDVQGTRLY